MPKPKLHLFIVNAFRRGRTLFGTPKELKPGCSLQAYFFDTTRLVDGTPPRDRCCKLCHKIGHMVKECPQKKPEAKKLQYDDATHAEKVYLRRGATNRGGYENGGRGMQRGGGASGERQINYSGPGVPQRGYPTHHHHNQFEEMRSRLGFREMASQRHVNSNCAPNWNAQSDALTRMSYSNYYAHAQEANLPWNHQSGTISSGGNGYNREDPRGLRSSPPQRGYETPHYQFLPSSKYSGGQAYERQHEYDLPKQNSGRYK